MQAIPLFGQEPSYSTDSLIQFISFEDQANITTKRQWSDSLWIIGPKNTLVIHESPWQGCQDQSGCDTLIDELWSYCNAYLLPRIARIHPINGRDYALIGYSTHHPIESKHIWLLRQEEDSLRLVQQFAVLSGRSLFDPVAFAYDSAKHEIEIISDEVSYRTPHVFEFGNCRLIQNNIRTRTLEHLIYRPWIQDEQTPFFEHKERIIYTLKLN